MKLKRFEIILTVALVVLVISGFATTWTQSTNLPNFSLSMSADGRIVCVAPSTSHASVSTNWGQTWTLTTNTPSGSSGYPDSVVVSADGTKIFLASDQMPYRLFISTNYGANWDVSLQTTNGAGPPLACSADGTEVLAGLYFSTNGGANWYTSSVPANFGAATASSADGRLMVDVGSGNIFFSTNFGATWRSTNLIPYSFQEVVCVSSDGKWIGVTGRNGPTFISSNGGADWRTNKINGYSIACSAHGTNWIIGGTAIYTSNDGGVTWQTNFSSPPTITTNWYGSAVSADGCEFIITDGGSIWTGYNTPSPQLNIQPADQTVNLSWLIPSTNFVLQQNSDLITTNWIAVSNSPVLNFTNLQQQVTVPSSPSNTFFRLISQ
jgi:hypothetical protein